MKTALVTGASGFIGKVLCDRLQAGGVRVRALLRDEREGPWHESVVADLAHMSSPRLMQGVHTVFHLAGKAHALAETSEDRNQYFQVNTEGTRKLLDMARAAGVQRFVFASSVKAMGEGGTECLDESVSCHPETPYGESKLAAEKLVLEGGYVPEPVVLRLTMVYGNSEKGNLPRMIRAVAKGRFPPISEVGNKRSMVHVDDVVRAAVLAADKAEAIGKTYIVTDGRPYSTRQIYEWICGALGRAVPGWNIPLPLLKTLALAGDGIGRLRGRRFMFDSDALNKLIGSAWYSSTKLERELCFHPERHLRESLDEIVRFLGMRKA